MLGSTKTMVSVPNPARLSELLTPGADAPFNGYKIIQEVENSQLELISNFLFD
jgi:hypothetical protein